jgi:hypothetical protein
MRSIRAPSEIVLTAAIDFILTGSSLGQIE